MRHGQRGLYSVWDLPQLPDLTDETLWSGGWPELDRVIRFYQEQFVVVTGKPGSGKSTFLFNLVRNLATGRHGLRTYFFAPENEDRIKGVFRRIWNVHGLSDVGCEYALKNQIFIQSSRAENYGDEPVDLRAVLDRAVVAMEKDQVQVLVIDPWNELEFAKDPMQNMTDYIRECLRYLKFFCRCYSATVILVVHPTKVAADEGRPVTMYDCEGSASWYNKADNGLILSRNPGGLTRVLCSKVREYGAGNLGDYCDFTVDERGIFSSI